MERLTVPAKKLDDGRTVMPIIDGRAVRECAMDFYWRLKEYEDLEEQGLLLRLPVAEGTTVYEVYYIYECEHDYDCPEYDMFKCEADCPCEYQYKKYKVREREFCIPYLALLNKTVFLTKAEAEKKLAEMGE